jgi:diguanylate cyclase (GGDEF)-like protein
MADLDRFKELNDRHGHETGDRALRRFARSIRYALRAHDLAARHGGEEFVMVLPGLDAAGAAAVVERVRFELGAGLADGDLPPFTASFGVADSSHAETFDDLLGHADGLLLAAKRAGRDRVFVAGVDAVELDAREPDGVEVSGDDPVSAAVTLP